MACASWEGSLKEEAFVVFSSEGTDFLIYKVWHQNIAQSELRAFPQNFPPGSLTFQLKIMPAMKMHLSDH